MPLKMPHSTFKGRYGELDEGKIMCACGHTFTFASKRDEKLKLRLHNKFCPNPQKYDEIIDVNRAINAPIAMTDKEYHKFEAKEMKKHYDVNK